MKADPGKRDYLLVIGDREALGWVLSEQRMAFPPRREREARRLAVGDRLLLYTTRGCFRNPTRDRGRVIGEATVASAVHRFRRPIRFGKREFPIGCRLSVRGVTRAREGLELAPLIPQIDSFPSKHSWSASLRRPLVPLQPLDARLLRHAIRPHLLDRGDALADYRELAKGRDSLGTQES
jgi:hypothetical protein